MSTPNGRPTRPTSVYDYAPKRLREQWKRGDADNGADGDYADDPATDDEHAARAQHGGDAEGRVYPHAPTTAPEDDYDEADEPGHAAAHGWEGEDHPHGADEARNPRTEDWLDELEYRAEQRERRAKAAEIDREYEDRLDRLAANLRTLRDEDDGEAEPERPAAGARRGRGPPAPEDADRDHYIDGVRLPRFLESSHVAPRGRSGRSGWLKIIVAAAVVGVVGVPLGYYLYAVVNPFAASPDESATNSEVQYSVASTANRLPKFDERVTDTSATASAPSADASDNAAAQAAPGAAQPPTAQTAPPQSQQATRRVPLTRVMRWPDGQDNPAPQPPSPRTGSVGSAWPSARPAPPPPAPAPSAPPTSLAYAPAAVTPAPAPPAAAPRPAPTRAAPILRAPPGGDTDEVQLLLKQGQEFIAAGDLATARIVLRRAAQAGAAPAAFALAQTYDARVLAKMRARGVDPDPAEARRWYETAQKLGSSEAAQQLEALDTR